MSETKQKTEQNSEAAAQSLIADHLRFFNQGCEVPPEAIKEIKAGRLKGMSDVNPMWRMKRMTEIFGPCGIGWKYTIDRQWCEAYGDEVKCFCNVSLYVRDPETGVWSDAIPGNGGSSIVSKEKSGLYVNDEGYKMALTDALSIAMKPLGIGANIWLGNKSKGHNESKYEEYTEGGYQTRQAGYATTAAIAYTDQQLKSAIAEINCVTDVEQYSACWNKWANACPALAQVGTDFYKAAAAKITALNTPAK